MVATQPHSAGVVLRIKVAGGEFEGSVGGVEIHAVDPENRRLRRAEQALCNFPKSVNVDVTLCASSRMGFAQPPSISRMGSMSVRMRCARGRPLFPVG